MMIMLHILIAISGLVASVLGLALASRTLVKASYGFIVATVGTGVFLLVAEPGTMLHVCVSGLTYVALATGLTQLASGRVRRMSEADNK